MLGSVDSIEADAFLTVLAEALVLSGMSMSVAGSSRPSSGGDHEIHHAFDLLFPGAANHGEQAGLGAAFCFFLAGRPRGSTQVAECCAGTGCRCCPTRSG